MRGYLVVLCVSAVLSACGGGGSGVSEERAEVTPPPTDPDLPQQAEADLPQQAEAEAAALQRQSEMGTATLGTARLQ